MSSLLLCFKSEVSLSYFRTSYLDTLDAIHGVGVSHGDLRLENIMLDSQGKATIIDFTHATVNAAMASLEAEHRIFVDLLDDLVKLPRRVNDAPKAQPPTESRRVTRSMGAQRHGSSGMILRARR